MPDANRIATAAVRAQCLQALMSNPDLCEFVRDTASKPGGGGQLKVWTDLAREYADALLS